MSVTVDVRGYSCPEPVMQMRAAEQQGVFPIEVLVETVTSRENVRRAAEMLGLAVKVESIGDDEYKLILEK